jgi:hypothetical protein
MKLWLKILLAMWILSGLVLVLRIILGDNRVELMIQYVINLFRLI